VKWREVVESGAAVFIGQYQHTVDGKGRMFMPARFREQLGDAFIITRGLDNCLFIYTQHEWADLTAKLESLQFTRRDHRAFARMFFSGAAECTLDGQGRCLIPPHLRDHARLEREAVIIGVSNRIEVWSRQGWETYNEQAAVSYEDTAEKLESLEM